MSHRSVLIVEDESIVALDLDVQLSKLGYDVVGTAISGEGAVEAARRLRPAIILMDVRLQGEVDGIEAARRIRGRQDVPIVFLTAHSDDETVRRAAATAPYGYLTKPFQVKELRAGIEVALTKADMERQLREADRWFAHTLRCVVDGVVVTDAAGRVRFLNPAAERLTGWSLEAAAGRGIDEVLRIAGPAQPARSSDGSDAPAAPSAPDAASALVARVIEDRRPRSVTHGARLIGRDGRETIVDESAGPVFDDGGLPLGAVFVLRDATERLAQEASLRASEERFRETFDHAPLGMALVSMTGEFIQVNAALGRLLDRPIDQLVGRRHDDFAADADFAHERRRLDELSSARRGVVQFERSYARPNGDTPVPALVSVSLMKEIGPPSCWLVQVMDLTVQKQAAAHLAALAEERLRREAIEMASQLKSEFLSRASHEMRTPLNAVMGFAQLLEVQRHADNSRTGTYARHIRAAGEHLLHLVNDVLDLNRAEQGTLRLDPKPLNLANTVRDALALLEELAAEHGITIESQIAPDLAILADPVRWTQVLLNLGSNAIKYNRQNGQVRLQAAASAPGRVSLTIADTGIGMTPEQLERLYQPFERLGREKTTIPGVGLGMMISRSLVEQMDGVMALTSQPRAGTTVTLELPAAPP